MAGYRSFVAGWCLAALPLWGCADPCLDDGLLQEDKDADCPAIDSATEGDSDSATESDTDTVTMSASMSASQSMSASESMSASGTSVTDTDTDTDSGGDEHCVDADGDGFGDPDMCDDMPGPDTVPNGDDCDDTDENTFPGAAPNDDEDACMKDADDDDWGDDDPPEGVDPGTDCDDDNAATFPGAAPNDDEDACMQDEDDDDWGDADPDDGVDPGADCFDGNVDFNPDTLVLSGFETEILTESITTVDVGDASLSHRIELDIGIGVGWDPVSSALAEDGRLLVTNDSGDALWEIDYEPVCEGNATLADVSQLPNAHGVNVICGIAYGPDGELYGMDTNDNALVQFDADTGDVLSSTGVTLDGNPIAVGSCGLTFDCHEQRLLWASGVDGNVYAVNHEDATVELLADTDGNYTPTGVAYDPVDRQVYISGDTELFRVQIDGSNQVDFLGNLSFGIGSASVSNLDYLPVCI